MFVETPGHYSVVDKLHDGHRAAIRGQRMMLEAIAQAEIRRIWIEDGCRDLAHWVSVEIGIKWWDAQRWVNAIHALPHLPQISTAWDNGELDIAKVVELCRFATPETETDLIPWARRVAVSTIKARADRENAAPLSEVVENDDARFLTYWQQDGRMEIHASVPVEEGAAVMKALDRIADRLPDVIDEDTEVIAPEESIAKRRADALVTMALARITNDKDADLATVVVHANVTDLINGKRGATLEDGTVIHPETALRLGCDCRLETVLHDDNGRIVGIGRASRIVPRSMKRALLKRDGGCTFPGCNRRRFVQAHHIEHWSQGGPTDLDNLTLVCSFHHKLVHERLWGVKLDRFDVTHWFRPGGRPYGPGPPRGQPAAYGNISR